MVKAVIFDLDDTLISERDYIISGYRHVAELLSPALKIDKDILFSDMMELFEYSSNNVFNRLLEKYKLKYSDQMITDLVNEYRSHFPSIKFYNDVLPCLQELKAAKIKTGIITDGYAVAQRQKLKAVEAYKYFDEILITDELGREYWKPHSKAFILMKERLGFDYDEMIYVGDNILKDFVTPNELGLVSILIRRRNSIYSNITNSISAINYIPKIEIESFAELIDIISNKRDI